MVNEESDASRTAIIDCLISRLPAGPNVQTVVAAAVDTLSLGSTRSRDLQDYLVGNDDALISGKSDGPPSRIQLLILLSDAYPDHVVCARCVRCKRQTKLLRYLDGERACGTCYWKSRTCQCSTCGQTGIIAKRASVHTMLQPG